MTQDAVLSCQPDPTAPGQSGNTSDAADSASPPSDAADTSGGGGPPGWVWALVGLGAAAAVAALGAALLVVARRRRARHKGDLEAAAASAAQGAAKEPSQPGAAAQQARRWSSADEKSLDKVCMRHGHHAALLHRAQARERCPKPHTLADTTAALMQLASGDLDELATTTALQQLQHGWRARIGEAHGLQFCELLGRGAYATVWKARWKVGVALCCLGEPLAVLAARHDCPSHAGFCCSGQTAGAQPGWLCDGADPARGGAQHICQPPPRGAGSPLLPLLPAGAGCPCWLPLTAPAMQVCTYKVCTVDLHGVQQCLEVSSLEGELLPAAQPQVGGGSAPVGSCCSSRSAASAASEDSGARLRGSPSGEASLLAKLSSARAAAAAVVSSVLSGGSKARQAQGLPGCAPPLPEAAAAAAPAPVAAGAGPELGPWTPMPADLGATLIIQEARTMPLSLRACHGQSRPACSFERCTVCGEPASRAAAPGAQFCDLGCLEHARSLLYSPLDGSPDEARARAGSPAPRGVGRRMPAPRHATGPCCCRSPCCEC